MRTESLRELIARSEAMPSIVRTYWPRGNSPLALEGSLDGHFHGWAREFSIEQVMEALCRYDEEEREAAIQMDFNEYQIPLFDEEGV